MEAVSVRDRNNLTCVEITFLHVLVELEEQVLPYRTKQVLLVISSSVDPSNSDKL
jgi:hypothetical protein